MKMKHAFRKMAVLVALVSVLVLSLGSCSSLFLEKKASFRFQNMTDFDLYYGIKFGEAEYRGYVASGFSTGYLDTSAGTYSLQALNASGQWVTISSGSLSVQAGRVYTIAGSGTGGYYYWTIVQDS